MINVFECYKELKFVYSAFPKFKQNNTFLLNNNKALFLKKGLK